MATRVLIGDDHEIVRRGLRQLLGESERDIECLEAADGKQIFEMVKQEQCDLVILDLNLPDCHGLDVLKELNADFPQVPVLVLSMHEESQYAARVMKSGAMGYVTKDFAPTELLLAVEKVLDGEKYISMSLAEKLASTVKSNMSSVPHEALSDREYQVLCLLSSGKILKEIADELKLSNKTISTYRSRILEKMNMASNSDLVRYAISNKLVV